MQRLIINADDFGLTESCSMAISEAFAKNLISSTTACANGEYIENAYKIALENGFSNSIGIHINLTEGTPLTNGIKTDDFFCNDGVFHGKINRLKKPTERQIINLKKEVAAQVKKMLEIGFSISHADSHHHIHTDLFFIDAIEEVLNKFGINRIRLHRNFGKIPFYKMVVKNSYNRKLRKYGFITTDKMGSAEDAENCPSVLDKYLCEIMVHPDYDKDGNLIDRIKTEDGVNLGPELKNFNFNSKNYRLISYREL